MEIDEIVKLVKDAVEKELNQKEYKNMKRIPIEASGRHIHLQKRMQRFCLERDISLIK